MDIAVRDERIVGVRGRTEDPGEPWAPGPQGLVRLAGQRLPDRLTRPLIRINGELVETDWDTAMERVVTRTKELLDEQGPSAIGFYTTGQLFLEEYYTLAVIAHGGLGTNHVDGNTRLCTATAAAALKESFGCDGQPGSYTDVDHADVIALYGHNMAETQTVLWTRILDRLAGPNPPQVICVDPPSTGLDYCSLAGMVGNEYAQVDLGVPPPRPLEVLFHSPLTCQHRPGFADVTYYTAPSGAGVFSAGTQWWICGVDPGCTKPGVDAPAVVRTISAITTRLLDAYAQGPWLSQAYRIHYQDGQPGRSMLAVLGTRSRCGTVL